MTRDDPERKRMMTDMPEHAKPAQRDRLLPALVLIVACGLLEVWASWLTIASVSGFPKLGRMTTGWILPVTTEAYWTVALYAWIVDPVGPRSRRFAMWTAIIIFALSLTGQEGGHLVAATGRPAPALVVGLVTALPLIAIGLGAVLIHLRHLDREAAEAAERARVTAERQDAIERAEADERTALRAELEALGGRLAAAETAREDAARLAAETASAAEALTALRAEYDEAVRSLSERETARQDAEQRAARAEAKTASLARKMEPRSGAKNSRTKGRRAVPARANDVDARTEALRILDAEPDITGKELGERLGMGERWGQLRKQEYAALVADASGGE